MKAYRLYIIGGCGGFIDVIAGVFDGDDDAVASAQDVLGGYRAIEVWQQSRFVSLVTRAAA